MERVNRILEHKLFRENLAKNNLMEVDRRFCRHNMTHFLDVARIASILNEEENQRVNREWIYAAALLHDLGRHVQYKDGTPHEIAGAGIAPSILKECGFKDAETDIIAEAILVHRDHTAEEKKGLMGLLYRADKLSRACFACEVESDCHWKGSRKNLMLRY